MSPRPIRRALLPDEAMADTISDTGTVPAQSRNAQGERVEGSSGSVGRQPKAVCEVRRRRCADRSPLVTTVCFSTEISTISTPCRPESAFLTLFAQPPQCMSTKNSDFTPDPASGASLARCTARTAGTGAAGSRITGSARTASRSFAAMKAAAATAAAETARRAMGHAAGPRQDASAMFCEGRRERVWLSVRVRGWAPFGG